jgi:hypothetical protein
MQQGVCYLKAKSSPVRGVSCTKDCWYWGRVVGHPHEMSLSLKDAVNDLGLQVIYASIMQFSAIWVLMIKDVFD